jgi:NADH:ubiquinone oxidoreductase subunit E
VLKAEEAAAVKALLGSRPRERALLIEHLHLIQDREGCLPEGHLQALAEELKIPMAEVYEVATFYAHFDVVADGEPRPPAVTVRVCDSLSCMLAGAEQLLAALQGEKMPGVSRRRVDTLPLACLALDRLLAALKPRNVVFSAFGLREGFYFSQLPDAERARHPLIAFAEDEGVAWRRFENMSCSVVARRPDMENPIQYKDHFVALVGMQ